MSIFGHFFEPAPARVSNAVEVVDVYEIAQDAAHVVSDVPVGRLHAAKQVPVHQLIEQRPQRVMTRPILHRAAQVPLGVAFISTMARSLFAEANTTNVCSCVMLAVA